MSYKNNFNFLCLPMSAQSRTKQILIGKAGLISWQLEDLNQLLEFDVPPIAMHWTTHLGPGGPNLALSGISNIERQQECVCRRVHWLQVQTGRFAVQGSTTGLLRQLLFKLRKQYFPFLHCPNSSEDTFSVRTFPTGRNLTNKPRWCGNTLF